MPVFNADVESEISKRINAVAQQTYYSALASGQSQSQALEAAKFAWQQKMDEATQTGMWNGQYNMPTEQWFTGQFGQWYGPGGTPQAGDQTLTAQQQQYNQAYQNSQAYGQYFAPGTGPIAGNQTQGAISQAQQNAATQAGLTGYYTPAAQTTVTPADFHAQDQATQQQYLQYNQNDPTAAANKWAQDAQASLQRFANENPTYGQQQTLAGQEQGFTQNLRTEQEARAAQAQQQSQAQSYLSLLASLRGPADWAKYQQVLGSTPGGMRDLAAAAMGQYVPGGGATTGYQPQAASLQSMMGQVGGYDYSGQGGGQLNMPNVYQGGQGSYGQPQGQAWGSGIGIGQQGATPQQQQQGLGGGTNLPAPNQIAAQSWNNMAPSQQQMLLGMYENQGWNKDDVLALHNQSLPKYTAGGTGTGTYRLQ